MVFGLIDLYDKSIVKHSRNSSRACGNVEKTSETFDTNERDLCIRCR